MVKTAQYKPNIQVADDVESLARQALDIFCEEAGKALENNGIFRVAVSGGHTPERFFQLLGQEQASLSLDWSRIHLFWVDERYVPKDSPQSNYRLAEEAFLTKVPIPPENVHAVPTHYDDFSEAASEYEHEIRSVFNLAPDKNPEFDLIALGMGKDGHTGSLFPDSIAMFDSQHLACVVYVLDEKLNRITLTCPVLCGAKRILVLVTGAEKAPMLGEVLTEEPDEIKYPIHILWRVLDRVTWLVDRDAAADLPGQS